MLPDTMSDAKKEELTQLFGVPGDWRDTVATFLDLGYIMRFQPNIAGELMIHCHILNHEDQGM